MDRLSIILTLMTGAVITGIFIVSGFTLGFYSWWTVTIAAGFGYLLAWPAAYVIARHVKRQDPNWRAKSPNDARTEVGVNAPEI